MWHRKVYIDLHAVRQRSPALADWLSLRTGCKERMVILIENSATEKEFHRRAGLLRTIDRKRDKEVAETKQSRLGF